jgi:hypothetical protein
MPASTKFFRSVDGATADLLVAISGGFSSNPAQNQNSSWPVTVGSTAAHERGRLSIRTCPKSISGCKIAPNRIYLKIKLMIRPFIDLSFKLKGLKFSLANEFENLSV